MAEGKKLNMQTTDLELNGLSIPLEWIETAAPIDSNARGIVLASERAKFHIMIDGRPVEHLITLYAQRAPLGEEEIVKVQAIKAEREVAKLTKEASEQAKRDREVNRAVELTKDVAFSAMSRATAQAADAAKAIETLAKLGIKLP